MNPLNSRRYTDLVDTVNANMYKITENISELSKLAITYLKIKIALTKIELEEKKKKHITGDERQ